MTDKKPRSWVICAGSLYESGKEPKGYLESTKTHLVEKSYATELEKQLAEAKAEIERLRASQK